MTINDTLIRQQLQRHPLPTIGLDLITLDALKATKLQHGVLTLDCEFGFAVYDLAALEQWLADCLKDLPGVTQVRVNSTIKIQRHRIAPGLKGHPRIKNIIAIASAKGGVGKSTTACNIALALSQMGRQVGMLDADIYGPNQPHLFGVNTPLQWTEDKKMLPVMAHGVALNSVGLLVDNKTPAVWRGPMVSTALEQLYRDTLWPALDYLIIDMPPGTGDIPLTLSKKIPVSGAVIVTTPQALALLDAGKGLAMFRKVNVTVLGIVENMARLLCQQCGHSQALSDEQGAKALAVHANVPLLSRLDWDATIHEASERGEPVAATSADSHQAEQYALTAERMTCQLALQPRDFSVKLPGVVVE